MESPNAAVGRSSEEVTTDAGVATTGDAGAAAPLTGNIGNAARVVAGMRARFRACYQALLDRHPTAEGQVRLAFRVDCEGRIATITAQASGVDRETVECMFAAVGNDRFDPPAGGKAVVNVPVNLLRQTKKDPTATPVQDAG